MTFRRSLAVAFTHVGLLALFLVAGLVFLNVNAPSEQQSNPAGVSECWDGSTGQISVVVGKCPRR